MCLYNPYVFIHTYLFIHAYICECVYTYLHMCLYIHMCLYNPYVFIQISITVLAQSICVYTYIFTYIHTFCRHLGSSFASEQCRQGPRAFLPCLCHVRYAALAPIVALQLGASTPSDAHAGQPFTVTAFARGETGGSTKPPAFGMLSWRPPACLSR